MFSLCQKGYVNYTTASLLCKNLFHGFFNCIIKGTVWGVKPCNAVKFSKFHQNTLSPSSGSCLSTKYGDHKHCHVNLKWQMTAHHLFGNSFFQDIN